MVLESKNHNSEEELSLNKKSALCGMSIVLSFLIIGAILHFSSCKQSIQIASLVFATSSVFAGLTGGLITYCYNERKTDHILSSAGVTSIVLESKTK